MSEDLPGLYLWGFLTPPVDGADLRAALEASCLRGALPPVDLPEGIVSMCEDACMCRTLLCCTGVATWSAMTRRQIATALQRRRRRGEGTLTGRLLGTGHCGCVLVIDVLVDGWMFGVVGSC
jgi:hypothetical protein